MDHLDFVIALTGDYSDHTAMEIQEFQLLCNFLKSIKDIFDKPNESCEMKRHDTIEEIKIGLLEINNKFKMLKQKQTTEKVDKIKYRRIKK